MNEITEKYTNENFYQRLLGNWITVYDYGSTSLSGINTKIDIMKAKLFMLQAKDFIKGLFLAIITAILTFLANELQIGSSVDVTLFKRMGIAAIIAFLSYIVKNLLTNSKDEILTPEK